MVVILSIPGGFKDTVETVVIPDARTAKQAINAAKAQFPRDKRDSIKAEVKE